MAKSGDAKEARLRELPLFRGADKKAIEHLASAADEVTVRPGHILIRQGSHHDEIYVLESGSATVEVDDEVIAEIPAGEFVGELSYFVRKPASATVRTSSESHILVIPYNRFGQILDDNPQFVRAIVIELAERLNAMDDRLRDTHGD